MQCPECGTAWSAETTCETHFHQMLFWEAEFPELGVVHHLMVLCYHVQHPHLYSPTGLQHALGLLVDFVEHEKSPQQMRQHQRATVTAENRAWPVTARPGDAGRYLQPIAWTMTAEDVVVAGSTAYIKTVRRWAESLLADLKASGNLAETK